MGNNQICLFFIYFDFTAAIAADRPALSARAGWKKEKNEYTVGAWTLEMESVCIVRIKGGNEMVF